MENVRDTKRSEAESSSLDFFECLEYDVHYLILQHLSGNDVKIASLVSPK